MSVPLYLMEYPELPGRQCSIFFKLLGKREAVRIPCPGSDLLNGQAILQKQLFRPVQSFLDEISMGRHVKLLTEKFPEVLISKPQIFRRPLTAVIRNLSTSQKIPGLIQKSAYGRPEALLFMHVINAKHKLLGFQKQIRQLLRRRMFQMVIEHKTPVQKGLMKSRIQNRLILQEPHMLKRTICFVPKTDKKFQPFSIFFCNGGMSDIRKPLDEAPWIDLCTFSVLIDVNSLSAQKKKGAIILKNQVFILRQMAGVMNKSTA